MNIRVSWAQLKTFSDSSGLNILSVNRADGNYFVFVIAPGITLNALVQVTNPRNADQIDFEDNYKNNANKNKSLLGEFHYGYNGVTGQLNSFKDIVSINLKNGASYKDVGIIFSCQAASRFQLVYRVSAQDTVIYEGLSSDSNRTVPVYAPSFRLTVPQNGSYTLVAKAMNLGVTTSNFSATISGVQIL